MSPTLDHSTVGGGFSTVCSVTNFLSTTTHKKTSSRRFSSNAQRKNGGSSEFLSDSSSNRCFLRLIFSPIELHLTPIESHPSIILILWSQRRCNFTKKFMIRRLRLQSFWNLNRLRFALDSLPLLVLFREVS